MRGRPIKRTLRERTLLPFLVHMGVADGEIG